MSAKTLAAAAALATVTAAGLAAPASAAPNSAAPNSASNEPGFRTERVTFQSGGETLVGTLYLPAGTSRTNKADAVIVTGAWMTIKEQMPAVYARELAQRGIAALTFDFRTWGESGGRQRSMESPTAKIADIEAAARFLVSRSEINHDGIGGLGICASAGYMVTAAANSPLIRSVSLVAPWLHDRAIVDSVYGGEASVANLIGISRTAQAAFDRDGSLSLVPAAGPQGSNAVMAGVPYYTETDRGLVPQWENTFNLASWEGWLTFDAQAAAPRLNDPLLVVHSDAAAIPQGARQFLAAAPNVKGQVWLDGVSQFDFYDRAAPVTAAANAAAAHFRATL
jgi:uncharacterized protein